MANVLSDDAKNAVNEYKSLLKQNKLQEFYSKLNRYGREIKVEVSNFLLSAGIDIFAKLETIIPQEMFYGSKELKSVTIPGNIEKIGHSAFAFSSVESVTLTDVDIIDPAAFHGCKNLKSVDLGSVRVIKTGAFSDCDNLREVFLPETVQMIGQNAWPENITLKSGPRKRKGLRFPKGEYDWYRKHLVKVEQEESEIGGNPADQLDMKAQKIMQICKKYRLEPDIQISGNEITLGNEPMIDDLEYDELQDLANAIGSAVGNQGDLVSSGKDYMEISYQ